MGLWGSYVVARSAIPLLELPLLDELSTDWDEEPDGYADGWQVALHFGTEILTALPTVLVDLATATDAPTLTGYVMDSDTVSLDAYSPATGSWTACLNREVMRRACEEEDADFDRYPVPADATAAALAWAAAAGLTPDPAAVHAAFASEDDDAGEAVFFDLLTALGLTR